jgi:hypothetical protein
MYELVKKTTLEKLTRVAVKFSWRICKIDLGREQQQAFSLKN